MLFRCSLLVVLVQAHTPLVGHAGSPNTDGCDASCTKPGMGILARSESVLALAPPAAPSAVLASLWRGRWSGGAPFLFPFFFLPVFPPPLSWEVHAESKKVREYEPTVGNHIGSSACEFVFDES